MNSQEADRPRLSIDRTRRQARLGGTPVTLPDLSWRFLLTVAEAAPDPVASDALQAKVWGEIAVGPAPVKQRARLVREALRQAGCGAELDPVPAVRHRGYRLALPVLISDTPTDTPTSRRWLAAAAAGLVATACIALIAFWPRQPDPLVLSYSIDAAELSGLTQTVAAQFAALGPIEVRENANEHGGVALDGMIEGEGEERRVRFRLLDRPTGRLLASESYDLPQPLVPDAIDRIAGHFVMRMQDRLAAAYPGQFLQENALPDAAVTAYLAALDAAAVGHEAGLVVARAELERAIEIAPDFIAAHRRQALVLARLSRLPGQGDSLAIRALDHARTSARLAPLQPASDRALAMAYWSLGDLGQARIHLTRAQQRLDFLSRDLAALDREIAARDG